ncbi:MAG: NitT/TauT family transport system ATP-binding protein [Variibacter sp.]|jgi:NitT/TauT family transport system ATP-binding protein|nr:NitT/TauT family transport system ATP-binding protein [Variibacter sp.]
MLQIENVTKVFESTGRHRSAQVALDSVSVTVNASEFFVLLGPSGCGKSTLLRMIADLESVTSGSISLDGKPITRSSAQAIMVWQDFGLLDWRTLRRNVELGLELKGVGRKARQEAVERYLALVGLSDFADHYPTQISGGMKQRVGLARSLAVEPKVLLMDEPFGALDAQTRLLMQEELLRIRERTGATILFVTHSIDEAILLGDRIAVFSAAPGRVREILPVDLPRPRSPQMRTTASFQELHYRLYNLLRPEAMKAEMQ